MRRTTIEFMIGWLDALRRDDSESLRAMLDRDVVWQGPREEWDCNGGRRSRVAAPDMSRRAVRSRVKMRSRPVGGRSAVPVLRGRANR